MSRAVPVIALASSRRRQDGVRRSNSIHTFSVSGLVSGDCVRMTVKVPDTRRADKDARNETQRGLAAERHPCLSAKSMKEFQS